MLKTISEALGLQQIARERLQLMGWGRAAKRYAPNGKRECARRMRQIAAGRLTVANGLVTQ